MSDIAGLTVALAVVDGADVVFVERIENTGGARVLGHMGRRLPAHTTSRGKAIAPLDHGADAERRRAGFPPRVSRTQHTESDWEQCLLAVRTAGYAEPGSGPVSMQGAAQLMMRRTLSGEIADGPRVNELMLGPVITRSRPQGKRDWLNADEVGQVVAKVIADPTITGRTVDVQRRVNYEFFLAA